MDRRTFVAATSIAGVTAIAGQAQEGSMEQQYLELRKVQALNNSKRGALNNFLEKSAIPAMNRAGIEPVGVFNVKYGETAPTTYILVPHPSLESVVNLHVRLREDKEFLESGADFLNAPLSDPGFVRYESSLMRAFSHMPKVEVPEAVKGKNSRVFELRIYESHSVKAAVKKIEMFNEGGEIQIFRDTGLHPVFFGEALIGPALPNLTYMLAFESMEQRDANWRNFVTSDAWRKLSADEQYKDTVSNISDVILTPASFSQI